MQNSQLVSALAVSSLLLVISGCDGTLKQVKPTETIINTPSNPDNTSKNNSDYKAVSKDGFIAADDSASTSDGIEKVTTANN